MGVKVSPKHGLNPSITTCFWCGKDVGIVLLGRMKGDAEAPRRMCLNLEPCDECKAKFAQGVQVIEVTPDGSRFNDSPAFAFKPSNEATPMYPTGRFVVVKPECVRGGRPGGKVLCDKEVMDKIRKDTGVDA